MFTATLRTPCTGEGTDLANRGSETIELATDSGRACLGSEHTEAVARTELAEAKEDTVDDSEGRNVVRQLDVSTTHDEADDSLAQQTSYHGPLGSQVIDRESANEGTRHIEQAVNDGSVLQHAHIVLRNELDDCCPTKDDCQRAVVMCDVVDNGRRVNAELKIAENSQYTIRVNRLKILTGYVTKS